MNNKFKECSCDICNRNTDNWNKRFIKYNGEWYCEKHYAQLKRKGYIVKYTIGKYGAINDMPYGWSKENELNQRIYILWNDVIRRCYSEKIHKKQPCYKQCTCEEFLKLSNFVVLIKEIENDLSGNLIKIWNCAKEISEANKEIYSGDRDSLVNQGYQPAGCCNP